MNSDFIVSSAILLLLFIGGIIAIAYSLYHFRKRAKDLGFSHKGALFNWNLASAVLARDVGTWIGNKHPLAATLAFLAVAIFLFFIHLPYAGIGFVLFSIVMAIGTFFQRNIAGYDKHSLASQFIFGAIFFTGIGLIAYESMPLFRNAPSEAEAPVSITGNLRYRRDTTALDPHVKQFGVSLLYSTYPRCTTFTPDFSVESGDGESYPADCHGLVDHVYDGPGTYTARYLMNGKEIARTVVTVP